MVLLKALLVGENDMSKNLVTNYIMDIANHLWNPGLYGKASIMVGAGFSKNAVSHSNSTMPDWNELSVNMYKNICPPPENKHSDEFKEWNNMMLCKTSGRNVLKIAEEYAVIYGHNKLDRLIEKEIDDSNYQPSELHKQLLELPWNDVFTTNYDTLLEKSISMIDRNSNRNYKIIRQCKEIPGSIQPRIIKLHGCVNVSGPYIITEEDYRTYPMTYAPFVNTVQQAMLETQLCMIGFSGDDPNFLSWLGWLRDNMGEYCPKLYLCGIFDTMAESEKKLLENKGILLVDLSVIVDKKSHDVFFEAYKEFFRRLKSYKTELKINKLNEPPYMNNEKIDIDSLYSLLEEDHKILTENLFFPVEMNRTIEYNVYRYINHFLIHDDIEQNKRYKILYYLLYRLYKGLAPIYDDQSKKLEDIVKNLDFSQYAELGVMIYFYLCLMYRIDGKINQYESTMKSFESKVEYLSNEERFELIIEKSRYALCCLDYAEGIKLLDSIPDDIDNITILLKKIGMLCQFGQRQRGKILLQKVSSMFAQEKYSENMTAAYSGYINLLGRCVAFNPKDIKQFSDVSTYFNSYNIRYILNEYKSKILDEYYTINKKKEKEKSFNPNTYTYHHTIVASGDNRLMKLSFEYIHFIDQLCIPTLSEYYSSIYQAIQVISATSERPFWRVSKIARFNEKDEYNKVFSRNFMLTLKDFKDDLHTIFDNIKNIIDLYLKDKNKCLNTYIISFKNALDLFSRLAIHEKPNTYWEYINKIVEFWETGDKQIDPYSISNVIERIKYYIGLDELTDHLSGFLSNKENLSIFYSNIMIPDEISNNYKVIPYIDNIIDEISSSDISIRNKGLIKLFCVSKLKCIKERYHDIETAIWKYTDKQNGLPLNDNFFPYAWERFSINRLDTFKAAINQYFLNIEWETTVIDNGISGGYRGNSDIIHYYLSLFYLSSLSDKYNYNVIFNEDETLRVISYCLKYVNIDKQALDYKYDILGTGTTIKEKFLYIGMICSILAMQYMINYNTTYKNILSELEKLDNLLKECDVKAHSLKLMICCLKNYNSKVDVSKEIDLHNKGIGKSFYLGINELLCISENKPKTQSDAKNKLLSIIKAMPYMNSDMLIEMPNYLSQLISRDIFYDSNIDEICRILNDTFYTAHDIMPDELVWDFYYNLSMFVKEYKEHLKKRDKQIPILLQQLEAKLKGLQVPEINKLFEIE